MGGCENEANAGVHAAGIWAGAEAGIDGIWAGAEAGIDGGGTLGALLGAEAVAFEGSAAWLTCGGILGALL